MSVDLGMQIPDAGQVAFCAPQGSDCVAARECGLENPAPTNCEFCPADNWALCYSGQCSEPDILESEDIHEVSFTARGTFVPQLKSLVGIVLARQTTGEAQLSCDEIYDSSLSLKNTCLNVLTTRPIPISQVAETFSFVFSRFPSEQEVLLMIYGFDTVKPGPVPISVTCTPHTVGRPGVGRVRLQGQPMRSL